jgi:DNA-binding NtrC family response regulator
MAVDVMVVAEDEPLRQVLEIALGMDGYRVHTAAGEADALAALDRRAPDVLVVDDTMPLSEQATTWVGRHAPRTSLVLLQPEWDARPLSESQATVVLPMPFGLRELRLALTNAARPAVRAAG